MVTKMSRKLHENLGSLWMQIRVIENLLKLGGVVRQGISYP